MSKAMKILLFVGLVMLLGPLVPIVWALLIALVGLIIAAPLVMLPIIFSGIGFVFISYVFIKWLIGLIS